MNSEQVIFKYHRHCLTEQAPQQADFSEHSIAIHLISMVGYATALPAFVWHMPISVGKHFCSFIHKRAFVFTDMLIKEYYSLHVSVSKYE